MVATIPVIAADELPYPVKETSIGLIIEIPVEHYRDILTNANTNRRLYNECKEEYDILVNQTVPITDYEAERSMKITYKNRASSLEVELGQTKRFTKWGLAGAIAIIVLESVVIAVK